MVGAVGNDNEGNSYVEFLRENGINTDGIQVLDKVPTGQAYIFSHPDGDNSILIVGGAN